jgi:hypothetical protein
MHEGFTGQRRKHVSQNSLIVHHPRRIGRITLCDGLLFNHDSNILLWLLGREETIKLRNSDGWYFTRGSLTWSALLIERRMEAMVVDEKEEVVVDELIMRSNEDCWTSVIEEAGSIPSKTMDFGFAAYKGQHATSCLYSQG